MYVCRYRIFKDSMYIFIIIVTLCSCSHLVAKMKHVFEQVVLVDGTRKMRGDIIQKTLKVRVQDPSGPLCWMLMSAAFI